MICYIWLSSKYRIFFNNLKKKFSLKKNLSTFIIAISILFSTNKKGSQISLLIRSSHRLFNILTGYPVIRPAKYPANETGYPAGYQKRPDIRPAGYHPVQP